MHVQSLHAAKPSLAYAKLTATPTEKAWSQVYNAGNLFACISLTAESEGQTTLQSVGKEILNQLETEFFTLEDKSLSSISDAIQKSVQNIPETISCNFCLAFFKDSALYLFMLGNGKIIIKRQDKIGVLLQQTEAANTIHTASGYLKNGDTLVLETEQFANSITEKELADAMQLNLPNDIAETLSVPMHAKQLGDQAAIIIVYHGVAHQQPAQEEATVIAPMHEPSKKEDEASEMATHPSFTKPQLPKVHIKMPHIALPNPLGQRLQRLPHSKKIFLSITIIIVVLLAISIFLTKQQQEQARTDKLFASIYNPAQESYEEGQALESINSDVSQDEYLKAEQLLQNGQNKFPTGSKEATQIESLLSKVQAELEPSQETTTDTLAAATVNRAAMLSLEKANPKGISFSQNATTIFYITKQEVASVTKSSGKKETRIENDDAWENPVGVAPYQGNIYVLDTQNGVLKYVTSGDGFSKSDYFTTKQNLKNATNMAIDSSIYILFKDGSIKKYTKGEAEPFNIKGLKKPFTNPTKIFTDADTKSVYVLEPGTSRVVKLSKEGTFQEQYVAAEIKQAKDFEVKEADKKIYILSSGKVYQLDMK